MNQKVINELLKERKGKEIKNIPITKISIDNHGDYTRVSLIIGKNIPAILADKKTGEFREDETTMIFTTLFTLSTVLSDIPRCNYIASKVLDNPDKLYALLDGATVDIIQEKVKANVGEPDDKKWINPWSSDPTPITFEHDTIVNHVVGLTLDEDIISDIKAINRALLAQ